MQSHDRPPRPYRFAVIGAGPAGFYAAQALFKECEGCQVDLFDRLPTPFGLVRFGVAPDHPKIKSVTRVYDKIASEPGFRFIGNVDIGHDVTIKQLEAHYDQIVVTSGASLDRRLGIPGEDLAGSHPATAFVGWYNGHPDFIDERFNLTGDSAVVIGVGNVAVDVARILCRSTEELAATDIADLALEALDASNVRRIHVIGRRGPAQAAFTNPELAELGELTDAAPVVRAADLELDPISQAAVDNDRTTARKVEILRSFVDYGARPDQHKRLALRFLESPVEILDDGAGRVGGVRVVRNRLVESNGRIRAEPTDETEVIPAQLVFRSVGYLGAPVCGLPFREDWGIIPNDEGRVTDGPDGAVLPGIYVAGWIKRGPSGVIGTNKVDAVETVRHMLSDLTAGKRLDPAHPQPEAVDALLAQCGVETVDFAAWQRIDASEVARGERSGRPRVKYVRRSELLDAART